MNIVELLLLIGVFTGCKKEDLLNKKKENSENMRKFQNEIAECEKTDMEQEKGYIFSRGIKVYKKRILLCVLCVMILLGRQFIKKNVSQTALQQTSFFFEEGIETVEYNARFNFPSSKFMPDKIKVQIEQVVEGENGVLYDIRIKWDTDASERYLEDIDRFWLGYFYVMKDRICLIRDQKAAKMAEKENVLLSEGIVICQETEKEDSIKGEKGWHESITVDGTTCEYRSYNDLVETGYYECFTWEKGKGLVGYRSGFGAEKAEITLWRKETENVREKELWEFLSVDMK